MSVISVPMGQRQTYPWGSLASEPSCISELQIQQKTLPHIIPKQNSAWEAFRSTHSLTFFYPLIVVRYSLAPISKYFISILSKAYMWVLLEANSLCLHHSKCKGRLGLKLIYEQQWWKLLPEWDLHCGWVCVILVLSPIMLGQVASVTCHVLSCIPSHPWSILRPWWGPRTKLP